jgi:ABC-type sugar transport system ATPase subunit
MAVAPQAQRDPHAFGLTLIYVTHDQTEAMTFADKIVIMYDGALLQMGLPTNSSRTRRTPLSAISSAARA